MQRAQSGLFSMGGCWRDGEPIRGVRQINDLPPVEFRVVTQPGGCIGYRVTAAQNCKFSAIQRTSTLTAAISDTHNELRRVIVENRNDKRRTWLRAGMNVVGKMTLHDFASSGFTPPFHFTTVSLSSKLERTERLVLRGARFLICRICAALSAPSSGSY